MANSMRVRRTYDLGGIGSSDTNFGESEFVVHHFLENVIDFVPAVSRIARVDGDDVRIQSETAHDALLLPALCSNKTQLMPR